jgi:hypothetical protein
VSQGEQIERHEQSGKEEEVTSKVDKVQDGHFVTVRTQIDSNTE